MLTRLIRDTVFVVDSVGIHWEFRDSTAAYTIAGTSHADLRFPSLSFTEYSLDVYEDAICPRQYRLTLGGGVYAGVPFLSGNVRFLYRGVYSSVWTGSEIYHIRR